jgi:hypothetical protein
MYKVAFDIDCVLNNFEIDFSMKFGWDKRETYNLYDRYPDKKDEIAKYVSSPETYSNLSLNRVALKLFKYYQTMPETLVYIATARPDNCYDATVRWLQNNDIEPEDLLYSKDNKVILMAKAGIDFFVDDSVAQLTAAKEIGIDAWAWRQPWNRDWYPCYAEVHNTIWYAEENKRAKKLDLETVEYA